MSVARTGLPHTSRTPRAEDRSGDGDPTATAVSQPQLPATLLGAQVVHGGERGGPARRAAVSETPRRPSGGVQGYARRASSNRTGRPIPLSRGSPHATKRTPSGGADSATPSVTRTWLGPARAAMRAARLTVRPK
jgi:hypothetical protein